MHRVVILTIDEGCAAPRVPVLACRDALHATGAETELVNAGSDAEIDAVLDALAPLARAPGPEEAPPSLVTPVASLPPFLSPGDAGPGSDGVRLIVAAAADGQVRAIVRRLVRKHAPAPSQRPADLPADRTLPDLPPFGLLPLDPAGPDLASRLGLPRDPAVVAAAVLASHVRRFDLLRNDGGSVTLDGALLGGVDGSGRAVPFRAAVNVDDAVLSTGREQLLAAVVANAAGYSAFDGLPLLVDPRPADGVLDVAVALAVRRRRRVVVEVRRGRGRAAAVTPEAELPFLDDGVAGSLNRKRTWWMERAAWGVYAPE